jgi:sporulation protein YlmC with PRC-barrel domain
MKNNELVGMKVIDQKGNDVGKVTNISIDEENYSINGFEVVERKGILSHDKEMIHPDQIDKITDNMILNIEKD